ncbi:MAG: SLBB domain-containing protein [Anaeromyxobacteraceae bacterium]
MRSIPFRVVAAVVAASPLFWASPVALAQSLQQMPSGGAGAQPQPALPPSTFTLPAVETGDARTRLAPGAPQTPFPPVDSPIDPTEYVCGPGDVLELNFWGLQNFTQRVTVDLEGRAFVPKVGYQPVGGRSLAEARSALKRSVGGLYPKLGFDVTLAEPRKFLVQVVDNVEKPGTYPARAVDRVSIAVAAAGGWGPRPSKRAVELRRRDGTRRELDLLRFEQTGDLEQNPYLLDGDIVRVRFEKVAVTIAGGVNRPGRYELIGSKDLDELVALAGGLSQSVATGVPVSLVRHTDDDRQRQTLHPFGPAGAIPDLKLQDLDHVQIPMFQDVQQSISVVGALSGVTGPTDPNGVRRLPFIVGDTVRNLLDRIGGVGPLADLGGSYILRGGVPVPVDLDALVMRRDVSANRALELGDTFVVPFKRRDVLVQGAVFVPGLYPYNPTYSVEQYIALAGGQNRFARGLSAVRLVTPEGRTRALDRDLRIEPGSTVVVPERDFSRAEVVQLIISIAGVAVSGVAVVLAARR